jgi:hypothetical protein
VAQSGGTANAGDDLAAGKQWWTHVQALADDSMQGRLTGSAEYLRGRRMWWSSLSCMGWSRPG